MQDLEYTTGVERLGCGVGTVSHGKVVGKEGQGPDGSPLFHGCTPHTPKDHLLIMGRNAGYNWV